MQTIPGCSNGAVLQPSNVRHHVMPVVNLVVGCLALAAMLGIEAKCMWRLYCCWRAGQIW